MGQRLLPLDSYWGSADGINGVIPDTSRSDLVVLVYGQDGPKKNWAFPLRLTYMDPWSLEIYWDQTGLMKVRWPYEVDWYSVDWPAGPQFFVIGDNGGEDQAPVLIPNELTRDTGNRHGAAAKRSSEKRQNVQGFGARLLDDQVLPPAPTSGSM